MQLTGLIKFATNNVLCKCLRWWKTVFLHLIDIAVVNSFILFREHQVNFPDVEGLRKLFIKLFTGKLSSYSLASFREEIVRQLCDFPEYVPPVYSNVKPPAPPGQFETVHLLVFSDIKRNCVVCYKQGRGQLKVFSYCSAP